MAMSSKARAIATVDISPFTTSASDSHRLEAGKALVQALHSFGFVKVTRHGFGQDEIDEALGWAKKLFDLPYPDKMKAPHPPGPFPHRGYSGIGREKVYSQDDVKAHESSDDPANYIRKISDFKESYEIGSEHDTEQRNIWLPEEVLPDFRSSMSALYEKLAALSRVVLEAIAVGLGLDDDEASSLMALKEDYQLRLLHYPAISKQRLETDVLARLPAHNDWGTITLLFQDGSGGMELQDTETQEYLPADPEEGAFVLNVGDIMQRFSNDYFVSSKHRVLVPSPEDIPDGGIPARYSIPFFVAPKPSHTVTTLQRFVTVEKPSKYEPVRFDEYGALISKFQYLDDENIHK